MSSQDVNETLYGKLSNHASFSDFSRTKESFPDFDATVDKAIWTPFMFCYLNPPNRLYGLLDLGLMRSWVQSKWNYFCAALAAPILFHASKNGPVMNIFNLYLEMVDTYGAFILTFVVIGCLTLYRNTLFKIFHELPTRVMSASKFTTTSVYGATSHINFNKFLQSTKMGYRALLATTSAIYTKFTQQLKK